MKEGGGVIVIVMAPIRTTIDCRIPTNARTEHVGFLPTKQTLRAPSAKRRDVFEGGDGGGVLTKQYDPARAIT